MTAIEVTTETKINHYELGTDAASWDNEEQAHFLLGFSRAIQELPGTGLMQIHYIAEYLRDKPEHMVDLQWIADRLSEYFADPS